MLGDNISIRDMDTATLIRRARAGTLPRCAGGPMREMIGQRAYRIEHAEHIVNSALGEGRAMNADERGHVDRLLAEAEEFTPVIKELWERSRRELMEAVPAPYGPGLF